MPTFRSARYALTILALGLLIPAGCEGPWQQEPCGAIQTNYCEQTGEAEDECIQPLDMTVDVHE